MDKKHEKIFDSSFKGIKVFEKRATLNTILLLLLGIFQSFTISSLIDNIHSLLNPNFDDFLVSYISMVFIFIGIPFGCCVACLVLLPFISNKKIVKIAYFFGLLLIVFLSSYFILYVASENLYYYVFSNLFKEILSRQIIFFLNMIVSFLISITFLFFITRKKNDGF